MTLTIALSIADCRAARALLAPKRPVVFVPTMGALHAGHGQLITLARKLATPNGAVVASIFVNPLQFGPHEDFHRYPRPFSADTQLLEHLNTDLLFAPDLKDMYPVGEALVTVDPGPLATVLEGKIRPGHFRGVCTVVAKLLAIVQCDILILGQKDYQQQAVIRQMIADLNFPTQLIVAPTIREPDGLAMSSRNRYLSADQRPRAAVIYQALTAARNRIQSGQRNAAAISAAITTQIAAAGLAVDYALPCDTETLAELKGEITGPCVLLVAARLGTTRLIDNLIVESESLAATTPSPLEPPSALPQI